MNSLFTAGFLSMLQALLRIFIIIVFAGFLVRKHIVDKKQIDALSRLTVVVLLPSLVFSHTLKYFDPQQLSYWWLLPLLGIGMSFLGLLLAGMVFFPKAFKHKNLLAVASMQNAGYLVLPIGKILYPDNFTAFSLLTFLFILGYNPVLWTLGKHLVTSTETQDTSFDFKRIITPPAVANIISLLLVLLGWQHIFPDMLVDSVDFLGQAAIPVATFVLGATLGSISFMKLPSLVEIIKVLSVKYMLLPAVVLYLLWLFDIGKNYPLLSDFLIIQSAAAPATGLILQVRAYGGDRQKVGAMMLIAYIFCLFALPFWIALWHSL